MATQILETTRATQVEKGKLQRHFRRFDMFFYLICTVVTIDTIGAVASHGAQGFTWLLFLALFFFLPYALIVAELGSAFPQEGGQYVWSRLAFGRLVSCVNSVIYWVSNPIWVGGSLTIVALATIGEFFTPLTGVSKYLFALAFIWFTIGTAIISLRYGKWVPTVGAWARGAVLGFFTISVSSTPSNTACTASARRLLADLRRVHRRRAGAVLQFRRPRGALGGRRGDDQPAARRALRRRLVGHRHRAGLRHPHPRHPHRPAPKPDLRPHRVHRRGQGGVYRVWRPRGKRWHRDPDRRRQAAR